MAQKLTRRRLLVLVSLVLAAIVVACAALLAFTAPSTLLAPGDSRDRWAARGFDLYNMTYHVSGLVDCQVTVEVQGEDIVANHTTPQGGEFCEVMSVTDLFKRVDSLSGGERCGPNGCGCDGPIELSVVYDPALGYPALITQRLRPDLRWRYLDYWQGVLSGGGCTMVGLVLTEVEVISLTPLP